MTNKTITVTIYIDEETHKATIDAVHPGDLTPEQVMQYLVASAIEEKAGSVLIDPAWRFGGLEE